MYFVILSSGVTISNLHILDMYLCLLKFQQLFWKYVRQRPQLMPNLIRRVRAVLSLRGPDLD